MKELAILSGKGGTGKTSVVGALAAVAESKVLVDCDVDAANLHLITGPEIIERHSFIGSNKALIDPERCNSCGICEVHCRFDAINCEDDGVQPPVFSVDQLACEGCAVCKHLCPEEAISMVPVESGEWYESQTRFGPMVHGRLGIAQGNSGRLVSVLRTRARELATGNGADLIIIDGPPGIGCPAISTLTGCAYVLLVTEPTISGFHDLKRVVGLSQHFQLPVGVCINKYELNQSITAEIEAYATETGLDLLGRLAYDSAFTAAQKAGQTIVEYTENQTTGAIRELWHRLQEILRAPDQGDRQVKVENKPHHLT